MAKRPVTMSIRDEDLVKLDSLAASRRLTRGDAVGVLLEIVERGGPVVRGPEHFGFEKKENTNPLGHVGGSLLPQSDSPEDLAKRIKAEGLKVALKMTEKRLGVTPVTVVGDEVRPQPEGWEDPP